MGLGFSLLLFICFIYLLFKKRDIFHPAVITLCVWGVLLLIYNIIDHPLYKLSDSFYFIISLWIFPFLIASFAIDHIKFDFITDKVKLKCNEKLLNYLFPFFIIIMLFGIYETVKFAGVSDCNGIINKVRESMTNVEELHLKFPIALRISKHLSRFVIIGFLCYISSYSKIPKNKIVILFILLLISLVITGNKGELISLFLMLIYWLIKKYRWGYKKIFVLFFSFVILIMLVQTYRESEISIGEMNFDDILLIYALSSFPAFDLVISGSAKFPVYSFGGYVFESLSTVINWFTLYIPDIDRNCNRWVEVPYPTNVYTCILYYYLDFGLLGVVIFSFLHGAFWNFIYKMSILKNNFLEFFILLIIM